MIIDTATVLYYDEADSLSLQHQTLDNLQISDNNRVILPKGFQEGKVIVALIKGKVEILNVFGQRV